MFLKEWVKIIWFLIILVCMGVLFSCQSKEETSSKQNIIVVEKMNESQQKEDMTHSFIDNGLCEECHIKEFEEWTDSHHEQAMQKATEKTVLGDFNDARFTHFGVTSLFFIKEGKYFVHTDGPDGEMADFEIKYTFGVEPLQQYLIEMEGGRSQAISIAWDTNLNRWFHLYPDEAMPYDDPLHWTGRYQNWNSRCGECHTTHYKKGYDFESDSYNTTWSEINVSCQSCHGPGQAHLEWVRKHKQGEMGDSRYGLAVDFSGNDSRFQVDACARCHSRRHQISVAYEHGRPFMDDYVPVLLSEGLYHPDGQILDEVYVYGSFLQSKMFQKGVRCTDCHNPHTTKLKASGNALCVRCHQSKPPDDFPSLQSQEYDTKAHHFHEPDSMGGQCVNCHMPAKNYMVVDPRRDHSFRIPSPGLSVTLGVPNACNGCHEDKSPKWASQIMEKWNGTKEAYPPFAQTVAKGRLGERDAGKELAQLVGNSKNPAIVRATALSLLTPSKPIEIQALVEALGDEDPLVRYAAIRGFERFPPETRLASLVPLLKDPIRAVRIEAARVLSTFPPELLNDQPRKDYESTMAEFKEAMWAQADHPSSHLNLGIMHANQGQAAKAETSYLNVVRLDPNFIPVRFNLANLYNALGRNDEAEKHLRHIIQLSPEEGEGYYSLGLLLAEMKRTKEAAESMERAVHLLPNRGRVHYNYGLALQQLGKMGEAETSFRRTLEIEPQNSDFVYALTVFFMNQGKWEEALPLAQRLAELVPKAPGPSQLVQQIQVKLNLLKNSP